MNHHISERLLSSYLDGELCAEKQKSVSEHLEQCPVCRSGFKQMQAVWEELGALPSAEPDPFFYTRLKGRMQESRRRHRLWNNVLVPLSFTIVFILGAVTGTLLSSAARKSGETAFVENSVTLEYAEKHLQGIPDASFASEYMELVALSAAER